MGKTSMAIEKEYRLLVARFGTELDILLKVPIEEIKKVAHPRVSEGIARVRAGRVKVAPGYDGEYGKVCIFGKEETQANSDQQMSLF